MMPLCDSVRNPDVTSFPLLKLDRSPDDHPRFNCLVHHGGAWVRLKVPSRVDRIEMIPFDPIGGTVRATDCVFASTSGRQFQRVATLKADVAHRFAQAVGGRMARIGLDESDWLRRWAVEG